MSLYTFIDKSIYFPDAEVCIISDIHFSAENIHQTAPSVSRRIAQIIESKPIKTLILNGDTFSEFPFPQKGIDTLKELQSEVDTLILISGNHEDSVGGFGRLDGQFLTQDEYSFTSNDTRIIVSHGHTHPSGSGDLYVIGHLHPAENGVECAVRINNSYQQTDVLALPPFTDADTTPIEYVSEASPMVTNSLGLSEPYSVEKRF